MACLPLLRRADFVSLTITNPLPSPHAVFTKFIYSRLLMIMFRDNALMSRKKLAGLTIKNIACGILAKTAHQGNTPNPRFSKVI